MGIRCTTTGSNRNTEGLTVNDLQEHLAALPPGEVRDSAGLDRLLATHWDEFEGWAEGGMEGYKLRERMEQVRERASFDGEGTFRRRSG